MTAFDLVHFTLRDMTTLGGALRELGDGASGVEEAAERVVRTLYEQLVDGESGERCCALVRFFQTRPYSSLDPEQRDFARDLLRGEPVGPGPKCLTLLASAGDEPDWNEPRASRAHRAIPLASAEMVDKAPMISSLLGQLGVEVETLLHAPELLVEREPSSFNVFYVPDAVGSPYIPEQDAFVRRHGIRSVLGFGGLLPLGEIFAVILFSKVAIPAETAALFRTLALNVRMAMLSFDEPTPPGSEEARLPARLGKSARRLRRRARVATLGQLLEVYERSVLEQSARLYAEEERMRFQKTLLECQGEASLNGILSVSTDGTILFTNRRFAELWGFDAPEIGTKSWDAVLRAMADRTTDPAAFLLRAAELEDHEQSLEQIPLRDGRTFDRFTAPIRSREGAHFGRVWNFRDISAFKRIDQMKDEFISSVSHELRTPLTSIRGSLDLMLGGVTGALPPDAEALARLAQGNCERLVRLINDVLDIEKIEAGRMEFRLEPLALQPLLEQAVESIRPYGRRLGVGFELRSRAAEARAHVDPDRLMQVLENLLSNAAKFSPPGETVRVMFERRGSRLRVSVTDRGPGIPPAFQSHVFEKFAQAGSDEARKKAGTGLGLNIARAIVERLGGTIGFVSKPGAGATFHFELPEAAGARDAS